MYIVCTLDAYGSLKATHKPRERMDFYYDSDMQQSRWKNSPIIEKQLQNINIRGGFG